MKTAIITGASSGLGKEIVRQIADIFPEVDSYWLIARRISCLDALADTLSGKTTACLPLDLCDAMSYVAFQEKLTAEQPEVVLLVNCAGCGYLGNVGEMDTATQTRMVDLNVRALTAVTNMTVPYMPEGAHILNVSSIAAFCPTPRMAVYSSTKAYVSAYTAAVGEELRRRRVSATAVCPGPMATAFLEVGGITGNSRLFETLPYCDQVRVAKGALQAARAGRSVYTPKLVYKAYRLLAKVTPRKWLVKATKVV